MFYWLVTIDWLITQGNPQEIGVFLSILDSSLGWYDDDDDDDDDDDQGTATPVDPLENGEVSVNFGLFSGHKQE